MAELETDDLTGMQIALSCKREVEELRARFRKQLWRDRALMLSVLWIANEVFDWIDIDHEVIIDRAQGGIAIIALIAAAIGNVDKIKALLNR